MLGLFKKKRCQKCYNERGSRTCPRTNRQIGWECCNRFRADEKCPQSCDYTPKKFADTAFPACKSDSLAEFRDYCKNYMGFWINKPHGEFEDQSPLQVSQNDPQRLIKWLSSYTFPSGFPLGYLLDLLKLDIKLDEGGQNDPESVACNFLDKIITLDWQDLSALSVNNNADPSLQDRYQQTLASIKRLKELTHYQVLACGISEDQNNAFVHFELNYKYDWTLILSPRDKAWRVRQNLNGNPQVFYNQNAIYSSIADALGKGDEAAAWTLIEEVKSTYPDSADLMYYYGVHSQMVKNLDRAKVYFFNAIALDCNWHTPYRLLANIYMSESNYPEARYWLELLSQIALDEPELINNIGTCYAAEGNITEAKKTWQALLKSHPGYLLAKQNLDKLP